MNIIEASKKALKDKKCIYDTKNPQVKMRPYLYIPFYIMYSDGSNEKACWNPTGEDILSETWDVCD